MICITLTSLVIIIPTSPISPDYSSALFHQVTLQLSNKGLKIIQNVTGKRAHENYRVNHLIDTFWPETQPSTLAGEREALHPAPRNHMRSAGFEPERGRCVDDPAHLQPRHGLPRPRAQLPLRQSRNCSAIAGAAPGDKLYSWTSEQIVYRSWWIDRRTRRSSLRLSLGCRRKVSCSETHLLQAAQSSAPTADRSVAAPTRELARTRAASWIPARRSPQCKNVLLQC